MLNTYKSKTHTHMDISTDYPFFIAAYLGVGLVIHNCTDDSRAFLPTRCAGHGWTWYGIFVTVGVFLAFVLATRCGVNMFLAALVLVLPTVLRFLVCRNCSATYNVTQTYLGGIPLIFLLFNCSHIPTIITGLAIASAFGRLGCLSAGCCCGPQTECDSIHYKYRDKNQQINLTSGRDTTCTSPSLVFETIFQFLIAGLCLRFPRFAPVIFGVGTSALVLMSEFWRRRAQVKLTALVLFISAFLCVAGDTRVCVESHEPQFILGAAVALCIGYVLSHDMLKPRASVEE